MRVTNTPKPLAAAVALALGALASTQAQANGLVITFADNTNPSAAPPVFSGLPFDPGTEYRLLTVNGSDSSGGNQDAILGGEQWIFDAGAGNPIAGAPLTAVSGTPGNLGGTTQAPITSGVAGFPICTTANTCPTLHQPVFFAAAYTFIAPVEGSPAGAAYGPARILSYAPGVAGGFQILIPVANFQLGTSGNHPLGADPNSFTKGDKFVAGAGPGILFTGTIQANGDFRIYADSQISRDEASLSLVIGTPPLRQKFDALYKGACGVGCCLEETATSSNTSITCKMRVLPDFTGAESGGGCNHVQHFPSSS